MQRQEETTVFTSLKKSSLLSSFKLIAEFQRLKIAAVFLAVIGALQQSFYGQCKGSFGNCQSQPSARPYHLFISLGLTALPPSSVCLSSVLGYCLPYLLLYHPLPSTPYVIHAWLACSLPYTLAICLTAKAKASCQFIPVFVKSFYINLFDYMVFFKFQNP